MIDTPWLICEKGTVYYIGKMTVSGSLDYVQLYNLFDIFRELGGRGGGHVMCIIAVARQTNLRNF